MSNLNKSDLIAHVANEAGLTRAQAAAAVDAVTGGVSSALAGGDKVTLVGFGTFQTRSRDARTGRNPRTGAAIDIPASTTVNFKPGQALRDAVNG